MKLIKTFEKFNHKLFENNDSINSKWISIVDDIHASNFYIGYPRILTNLLNNGADINSKGNYGYTMLIRCATYGISEIVSFLLIQANIDINIQNDEGCTALIGAATDGREDIVKMLLSRPEIDVKLESNGWRGWYGNFIDIINEVGRKNIYLIDYDLQKKIIDNNRPDIILFLLKYNLVHENIKKENPYIFTGLDLNLL